MKGSLQNTKTTGYTQAAFCKPNHRWLERLDFSLFHLNMTFGCVRHDRCGMYPSISMNF